MIDVAIIEYNTGNLFSVQSACTKVGLKSVITNENKTILSARSIILPGVGAFPNAMHELKRNNLDETIKEFVYSGKPLLGICLGMQVLFEESDEFEKSRGLGLIKGKIKKFKFYNEKKYKYAVPHVGWNKIKKDLIGWNSSPLKKNSENDYMYFVHSFYAEAEDKNDILSLTNYGDQSYCSAIAKKNIFAMQFHPEKSGKNGIKIYESFKEIINE
tara:strand:- start:1599 stop:2243 length:645 start_codon:yes stop_codon:yes gene_type:complete